MVVYCTGTGIVDLAAAVDCTGTCRVGVAVVARFDTNHKSLVVAVAVGHIDKDTP